MHARRRGVIKLAIAAGLLPSSARIFAGGSAGDAMSSPALPLGTSAARGKPMVGIAASVAHDVALKSHPDVIAYVDFKDVATVNADLGKSNVWRPGKAWYAISKLPDGSNFCVADPEFLTDHGLNFMRFSGIQRLIGAHLWAGRGVRHAFCRYVLVIEPDVVQYMTELGVKLPGFAGEYEDTVIHPPHAGTVKFSWRMEHGPKNRLAVRDYLYDGASGSGYGNIRDYGTVFPVGVPVTIEQELDVDEQQGRIWIDGILVGERKVVADVDIEMMFVNIYHGGRRLAAAPIHYRLAAACIAKAYIGPPPELPPAPLTSMTASPTATAPSIDGAPVSPLIRDNPRFGIRR